ncbi:MAG: head-tail adaptor protein [Oscillospiraceae bacterium]|nr:head-tail adaptor protein [Oscillospiraceae bacterium]
MKTLNAGKYNRKITIFSAVYSSDSGGFRETTRTQVWKGLASVKTTRGMTIIKNNSDFEKALTNFTIRVPKVPINRDMIVTYHGKDYTIEYLNNVNEDGVELEMQCKEVTH